MSGCIAHLRFERVVVQCTEPPGHAGDLHKTQVSVDAGTNPKAPADHMGAWLHSLSNRNPAPTAWTPTRVWLTWEQDVTARNEAQEGQDEHANR